MALLFKCLIKTGEKKLTEKIILPFDTDIFINNLAKIGGKMEMKLCGACKSLSNNLLIEVRNAINETLETRSQIYMTTDVHDCLSKNCKIISACKNHYKNISPPCYVGQTGDIIRSNIACDYCEYRDKPCYSKWCSEFKGKKLSG